MTSRQRSITSAIALMLALAASAAPLASADPQPLAQAEAAIANHGGGMQANPGPCSEVCSGGAYGLVNVPARGTAAMVSCGDACSGGGYDQVSVPATVVRVLAPDGGFDWGDAGIGAGSALALTMIGVGGVLTATKRRGRQTATGQRTSAQSSAAR